jgi:hypothetical protein
LARFGRVRVLAFIGLLAACNFQATRVDIQIDASAGEPMVDAAPAVDAAIPDTAVPPLDARLCYGAGIVQVCLTAFPSGDLNLPIGGQLDTGGGSCNLVLGQQGGPALCVIAGVNVTVTGNLVAVGGRPLVLIATDTLTVNASGTIDASSVSGTGARLGAGGNATQCSRIDKGQSDSGGAGGGAGGTFGTAGGRGGTGDLNNSGLPGGTGNGANPANAQPTPTVLHGGCSGSAGGEGSTDQEDPGGLGGDGGGAVYLIAGARIAIDGNVYASGAGGRVTSGSNGFQEGAGGGGSGGMIVLDAPALQINGRVVANGGAGGGGGGGVGGTSGGNGSTVQWNQRANAGIGDQVPPPTGPAGNGARGTAAGALSDLDGGSADLGGGGGAGGLGVVLTYGTLSGGAMMSPAPIQR